MHDPRYSKLAELLIGHSVSLKKGETVLCELTDTPDEFGVALVRAARKVGAIALVDVKHSRLVREMVMGSSAEHARLVRDIELARMKKVDAFIAVRGSHNATEGADIPSKQLAQYSKILRPVMNYRVNKTRWCVLRWPTPSMAQSAGMSSEAFEDFYFNVCTMDYRRMSRAMKPLEKRLKKANKVRLVSPGTDIEFSIKGIGAIGCRGDFNIPDGEVFSCPVKDSANGVIHFNAPSVYLGTRFENVCLVLRDGKIVEATSSDTKRLNQILDTDAGARYIGEFAIGFNPYILNPMGDILFDEKIAGSLHFTPGQAYEIADNGNRSAVHWDLVLIQRPEWGGGEIWIDGQLIRRNGLFVVDDLKGLNPQALK